MNLQSGPRLAFVSGEKYESEKILEIVRVSKSAIYFKTHLDYYNGHQCNIFGKASFVKAGQFTFNSDECWVAIGIDGKDIRLDDRGGTCQPYCGARGNLRDIRFPLSRKKEIKYMDRLKKSKDYINSVGQ